MLKLLLSGHARECDGPYGFVRAIREQIKNGVDHIKLNLTGGIMGPAWDRHWQSFLLDDEIRGAYAKALHDFEAFELRFASQARISILLVGLFV